MFHIPAHKNVDHPAGQVPGVPNFEAAFAKTPVVGEFMGLPVLKLSAGTVCDDQVSISREVDRLVSLRDDWAYWFEDDLSDNIDAPRCIPTGGMWRGGSGNIYLNATYRF